MPDVLEASPSVVEDALMPLGLNQDGGIIPLSPQAIIEIDQLRWRFGPVGARGPKLSPRDN